MTQAFRRETRDSYQLAVQAHRELRARRWPTGTAAVRYEALLASATAASHIAHGEAREGPARVERYRKALGSLARAAAAVEIGLEGDPVVLAQLRRCAALLETQLSAEGARE